MALQRTRHPRVGSGSSLPLARLAAEGLSVRPHHERLLDKATTSGDSMRLLELVFTLICLTATPAATQTLPPLVTGRVIDSAGRPMAGALVSAPGSEYVVRTDPAGRFAFDDLPKGFITLRAEFIGYLGAQRDSVLVESGRLVVVNFRLLDRPVRDNPNVFRELAPVHRDSE